MIKNLKKVAINKIPVLILLVLLVNLNYSLFNKFYLDIVIFITLTFISMRRNIFIRSNAYVNYIAYISLSLFAFLGEKNNILAFAINIIVITTMTYFLCKEYNYLRYLNLILAFVLMQLYPVGVQDLGRRIIVITYSYAIMILVLVLTERNRVKREIYSLINKGFDNLREGILAIGNEEYILYNTKMGYLDEISKKLNKLISGTYERKYFQSIILFTELRFILDDIVENMDLKDEIFLDGLGEVLLYPIEAGDDLVNFSRLLRNFLKNSRYKKDYMNEFDFAFEYMEWSGKSLESEEDKNILGIINFKKGLQTEELFEAIYLNKNNLLYSIRLSLMIGVTFLLSNILKFPKEFYLPLTVYLIAFPSYEYKREGNLLGIRDIILGILISAVLLVFLKGDLSEFLIFAIIGTIIVGTRSRDTKNIYVVAFGTFITAYLLNTINNSLIGLAYVIIACIIVVISSKYVVSRNKNIEIRDTIEKIRELDVKVLNNMKVINEYSDEFLYSKLKKIYTDHNRINRVISSNDSNYNYIQELFDANIKFVASTMEVYVYLRNNELDFGEKNELNKIINNLSSFFENKEDINLNTINANLGNTKLKYLLEKVYDKEKKVINMINEEKTRII